MFALLLSQSKVLVATLKPVWITAIAMSAVYQFDDLKSLNALSAGALVVVILYVVLQILKVIKGFNDKSATSQSASPQTTTTTVVTEPSLELMELLKQLVTIATENRWALGELKTSLAVHMDRQVTIEDLRSVLRDEKRQER